MVEYEECNQLRICNSPQVQSRHNNTNNDDDFEREPVKGRNVVDIGRTWASSELMSMLSSSSLPSSSSPLNRQRGEQNTDVTSDLVFHRKCNVRYSDTFPQCFPLLACGILVLLASIETMTTATAQQTYSPSCSPYAMPLDIKGKKFFKALDGNYVPIKGVDYYPRPNAGNYTTSNSNDFYSEDFRYIWERDVAFFKQLNVNAVRIYAVDPSKNHDAFMCALKEAGIYVIVGLAADCLDCAVTGDSAPACYPEHLLERGEYIVQRFSRYDNVIGFDAGNEVSLRAAGEVVNGPCQKQFIRDMRSYVKDCVDSGTMRHIPIGLAVADVERAEKALYYNCLTDPNDELESAEYLGMNVYLHCQGNLASIDEIVGFKTLLDDFTGFQLNIPVLLTEYGCISELFPANGDYQNQRDWLQVDALFDSSYELEFAGGFVFEYNTELVNSISPYPFTQYGPGNFGIGYFTPENCDEQNVTCTYVPFPQFDQLATRYSNVDMNKGPFRDDYIPEDRPYPTCPAIFPKQSDFTWPPPVNMGCPEDLTVICPNLPPECNTPTHPNPTAPIPSTPVTRPATTPTRPVTKPVTKPAPRSNSRPQYGVSDGPSLAATTFYPTIADLNVLNITNGSSVDSTRSLMLLSVTTIITTVLFFFV